MVKNLPAMQETQFNPWVGKMPWRREWQPTPVFLPGEFHGQRSLAGYSPWSRKESDRTEQLTHKEPTITFILTQRFRAKDSIAVSTESDSCSVVSDCVSMDCSPPGSSVHEILQARILEWVAISFTRGSFRPWD